MTIVMETGVGQRSYFFVEVSPLELFQSEQHFHFSFFFQTFSQYYYCQIIILLQQHSWLHGSDHIQNEIPVLLLCLQGRHQHCTFFVSITLAPSHINKVAERLHFPGFVIGLSLKNSLPVDLSLVKS